MTQAMRLLRFTRNRARLIAAVTLGVAAGALLPPHWKPITRLLIGWNVAVWFYLCLMGWLMMRADEARVRRIAAQEDEGAIAVLVIMSIAAALSVAAIIFDLALLKNAQGEGGLRFFHYGLTAVTVFGSWCLVAVVFTFHYARMFYLADSRRRPLRFADDVQHPDYWDFLYFSFTIAVAAQTSDVTVVNRTARKAVLAQSILSFLFNAAVLGLSINIAAGVVSG
jgi:uncharacterized membrane protein